MVSKPSHLYPATPTTSPSPIPMVIPDPSIKGAAFDQILQNRGIRFIHRSAAPCPNMTSLNASNHDPNCPFCDESQIVHLPGKEIFGVFTSNTLEKMYEIQGVWEIGSAVVTFPTEYADGTQADFNTFDWLVCPDFEVKLSDIKEYDLQDATGIELRYPVVKIDNMMSVRNGQMYYYQENVDYTIVDGDIKWISGMEPSFDLASQTGEVISILYTANPVYSVLNVMHELRVTQEYDIATGKKVARRLPQQVLVRREFLVNPAEKE